jgi:molybdate transport system substrate-binding protein
MTALNILSGGAAHGLVASLAPRFKTETGFDISGEFGAVGAMADRLRRRQPADLVLLTAALMATLAGERLVVPASIRKVGLVETALAVRAGDPKVSVNDADSLRAALLAADAIFLPDTTASTAGIHVAAVLHKLGIADEVASRLKVFANGATAMRQLAQSDARHPIGCTQATEIITIDGVEVSGALPRGCELATVYSVGIAAQAAHAPAAQILIDLMTAAESAALRGRAGFLNVSD